MFQWDWLRILHGALPPGEMALPGDDIEDGGTTRPSQRGRDTMSTEPFSEPVRQLLRDAMTSFERLEVLLFLRRSAPAAFAASGISQNLHIQVELVAEALEGLAQFGLLARGPEDGLFRFAPAQRLERTAEELAAAYRDQSAAVLSTMSIDAIARIRSGPMKAFADAFVLGKRKDDDG
jgi:hypothetical protein